MKTFVDLLISYINKILSLIIINMKKKLNIGLN